MRTTCSRECLLLLYCPFDVFFMPMIMNLLCFSDDEGEHEAPPAKKPKTGSAKSVNSGPEVLKEKASSAPGSAVAASNALTRMLAKNKNAEASAAAITPSSAAAAASAEEHVSTSKFAFDSPSICFGYYSPPK